MPEQRSSVYDKLDAWRATGYQDNHEELSVEAQKIIATMDADSIESLRNAPKGRGHPGVKKILADELTPAEWKALMRDTVAQSALAKRFLTKSGLAAFYKMLAWPLIYVFKLPGLDDRKANNFGEYAALWAQAYAPFGIPLLHHLMLLGLFMDGFMDCFKRKVNGEKAFFEAADDDDDAPAPAAKPALPTPEKEEESRAA